MPTKPLNVRSVFDSVIDFTSVSERTAYLDAACAGVPEIRLQVEALLQAHADAGSFMESPPPGVAPKDKPIIDQPPAERVGSLIGPYKLLEQIGEGGMGVIYMAQQSQPVKRRVALKLIKPGMDTRQVIARFEAERQALALMDHPHIARVLDAGATEAGRPYFVMELVHGIPITDYCEREKLDTRQRLELLIDVCRAVQHAHQKAIIHRDLKPGNVLVTLHDGEAVVKVIDFGVAKALDQELTSRTLFTQFSQMVGTPLYMSPEQAALNAVDVDTRSDIYSLGVLLYEMLTGTTPFDRDLLKRVNFDELRRIIREDDPPRPSARISTLHAAGQSTIAMNRAGDPRQLSKSMRGELDWIVMKALEKDRDRRYETASSLAADIQRHLDDEPVVACPPSRAYRVRKFARKHRATLTTVALVTTSLVAGLAMSGWQAVRATRAEAEAKVKESRALGEGQRAQNEEHKARAAAESERIARQAEAAQRQRAETSERQAHDRLIEVLRQRDLAEHRQAILRQYLYAADMKVASESRRNGRLASTRAVLDRQLPEAGEQDLRGFAWYLLNHACEQNDRMLRDSLALSGHSEDVYFVAVSPNGKLVASASKDRTVRLWNAESGRCLRTLRGHAHEVNSVSFAPDSQTIATASDDQTVRVWSVATGEELWALSDFSRAVLRVQFSPDGKGLATAEVDLPSRESRTTLWNVSSKTITHCFEDGFVLAFCPTENCIALSSKDLTIRLVDSTTGTVRHAMLGHTNLVSAGVFTPDGNRLVTVSHDSTVIVWDIETGREVTRFDGAEFQVRTMAISPDGRFLVIGGNEGLVRVWHLPSHRLDRTFRFAKAIWSVAYSRNEDELFVAGAEGAIRRYSLAQSPAQICLPEHEAMVREAAVSSDGKLLATVDFRPQAYVWSLPKAALLRTVPIESNEPSAVFHSVSFLPGDQQLILGDSAGGIHIAETASGREAKFWQAHERYMSKTALSQNHKVLATSGSGLIRIWNLDTQSLSRQCSFDNWIRSFSLSPDGASIVVTTGTGVSVWDIANEAEAEKTAEGQNNIVACDFSPDGKWFAIGSDDHSIKTWDAKSKREHATLLGHSGSVGTLEFSPDGRTLASGSANGEVKLWDLATGQELFDLPGHTGSVMHLAFSRDGQVLVTSGSSRDGKGEVWLWFAPRPADKETTIGQPPEMWSPNDANETN